MNIPRLSAGDRRIEFLNRLNMANSEDEWNAVCDDVKRYTREELPEDQRSGDYPNWWYQDVIRTGLAHRVLRQGASQ